MLQNKQKLKPTNKAIKKKGTELSGPILDRPVQYITRNALVQKRIILNNDGSELEVQQIFLRKQVKYHKVKLCVSYDFSNSIQTRNDTRKKGK